MRVIVQTARFASDKHRRWVGRRRRTSGRARGQGNRFNARIRRQTVELGATPNSNSFLDFPIGTPYTGPAFKLSVRLPVRGAAASAGFWQVVGVSRQFRGPPPPALIPRAQLEQAPEMISGVRSSEDTGMPTGTIARLLIDKGFGFIRDEGGIEHFFHRSSVRGAVFELLREGQRVEFTQEESGKGPRAGEVRLIES